MKAAFANFAKFTAKFVGRPITFVVSLLLTVLWAAAGPYYGYSDTWQLIINTSTTILTLFVALLIQNTQERDTAAIQAKLDEILRALPQARNDLIGLEERSEEEIAAAKTLTCTRENGFNAFLPWTWFP